MTHIAAARCTDGFAHAFPMIGDTVDLAAALCGLRVTVDTGKATELDHICPACSELVMRWVSDGERGANPNIGQA